MNFFVFLTHLLLGKGVCFLDKVLDYLFKMAWIPAWETDGFVFIESVKGNGESFGVSDSSAAFL